MEQARVVIVGAGPAGLVAGLSLAQQGVANIILEKEQDIVEDPRGVYLAADAVRILYALGLGPSMSKIGHELQAVNFHTTSIVNKPFHALDVQRDSLQQAVPTGVLQIQPALEKALRDQIAASELCELRTGCAVQTLQQEDDGVVINYQPSDGASKTLRTTWLIGADGKRGVVRKTFLEKVADIRQINTGYRYEGTWVAANLKIRLPTPDTHPDFPAWKLGLTPQEVYDLFWPKGWHFCSPPGKPTATGRFGPYEERMWRHEFRQDDWNAENMDAEALFWEHLTPMITRTESGDGKSFERPAVYPQDCIEILRCRPFTFTHKIVNRWYHRKTVLIGDAAHVFPPFGGQGIASGIRDAHQLAWRIALIEKAAGTIELPSDTILEAWAKERTQSVKDAAFLTKMNGSLCNDANPLVFTIVSWVEWAIRFVFPAFESYDPQADSERKGMRGLAGGFFLSKYGGGLRLPQVYVDTLLKGTVLSDDMFLSAPSPMQVLVLVRGNHPPTYGRRTIKDLLAKHGIPHGVISPDATSILSLNSEQRPESIGSYAERSVRKASLTPLKRLSKRQARTGYSIDVFDSRLGAGTKYVVVRPDFYIFATARNDKELDLCLQGLCALLKTT
ncbi:unnamed protein product [Zymoseptoria tritici ST99CH_1A5]|uniref:FAD-binding domain-containing protein n=1 Tax=Zymoseptoria tritici ST99CH_1A5 TaxID=1276529 RepID=A0A1Y6LS07_ZYMTR|nr:unnamed protein product [Zymoseptoria tritici ST99CH_1A5]